jgi:pimeloyl-ACP methyl ester carboxylesterase
MPIVQSNGISIDYESRGDPAAPSVLLVMGLGMPAALWPDEFVQGLADQGFRVVLFDNRDSGGSTRLAGTRIPNVLLSIARALLRMRVRAPYTLDDMAADATGLLDALGIERCHVVGASMGGMIAQVLAARQPQRVLSLTSIMSSTGNPKRRIAFGKRHALRALLKPPPPSDDIPAMVEHLVEVFGVIGSPGFESDPAIQRRIFERAARRGLYREGTERQMVAILGSGDRRSLIRQIAAPTLVIHGADDPLVPLAAGEDTAANIPGATLEVIDGMGHDFPPVLMSSMAGRIAEHCWAAQGGRPIAPVRAAAPPDMAAAIAVPPVATAVLPTPPGATFPVAPPAAESLPTDADTMASSPDAAPAKAAVRDVANARAEEVNPDTASSPELPAPGQDEPPRPLATN